jgi:uncharacterized Zn-binding protein involved in type VI secretion
MPPAARLTDSTAHGTPLSPGTGSPDVVVGFQPAWRALPQGVGGPLESASNAMKTLMSSPALTPVDATATLAQVQASVTLAAGQAAAEGNPAAPSTTASAMATLNTANVALTATYATASAVPGGAPAATTAYTEGIKAAASAAVGAAFSAIAGMTDTHVCPLPCPTPPHGPGVVTKGSAGVVINNLPAARQNDQLFEACGGADPITTGDFSVEIGE